MADAAAPVDEITFVLAEAHVSATFLFGADHMGVVLITGTSTGIGMATALAFGRAGHRVAATMRNPSGAPALGETAKREHLPITVLPMDVDADASVRDGDQDCFLFEFCQWCEDTPPGEEHSK